MGVWSKETVPPGTNNLPKNGITNLHPQQPHSSGGVIEQTRFYGGQCWETNFRNPKPTQSHIEYLQREMPPEIQRAIDHVLWRISRPLHLKARLLTEESAAAINLQKKDVHKARRKIRQGIKLVNKWKRESAADDKYFQEHIVPAHLKELYAVKHFGFIQRLTRECRSPDTAFAVEAAMGFLPVGNAQQGHVWEHDPNYKRVSQEDIEALMEVCYACTSKKPSWMDDQLIQATTAEVKKHIAAGKYYKAEEGIRRIPPARAFAIKQGSKIRTVIDLRTTNVLCEYVEKLRLMGTKHVLEAIEKTQLNHQAVMTD
jgi:hypothetical protein